MMGNNLQISTISLQCNYQRQVKYQGIKLQNQNQNDSESCFYKPSQITMAHPYYLFFDSFLLSLLSYFVLFIQNLSFLTVLHSFNNKQQTEKMTDSFFISEIYELSEKSSKKQCKIEEIFAMTEKILNKRHLINELSFIKKGIIIELLTKIVLQCTYNLESNLKNFSEYLHKGGKAKDQTTVRKTGAKRNRGNTTTMKKKTKQQVQVARNIEILDIQQILQNQLNSEVKSHHNNSKLASQDSKAQNQERKNQLDQMYMFFSEVKEQNLPNQFDSFTPIPKLVKKTQQNLRQLENLILAPKQTATKERKKAIKGGTTKKKQKITQALSEQINSYIDLLPNSNNQSQELKEVLERTKKKKKFEKENKMFLKEIFDPVTDNFNKFFERGQNLQDMILFQKMILDNQQFETLHQEDYQVTDIGSLVQDNYSKQKSRILQGTHKQNDPENEMIIKLGEEIKFGNLPNLKAFSSHFQLSSEEQASLFYKLLCFSDRFQMQQDQPHLFGPIFISKT